MIFLWIYLGITLLWLRPILRYLVVDDHELSLGPIDEPAELFLAILLTCYTACFWPLIFSYLVSHKTLMTISGGDINKFVLKLAGKKAEVKKMSYDELLQRNAELEKELKI